MLCTSVFIISQWCHFISDPHVKWAIGMQECVGVWLLLCTCVSAWEDKWMGLTHTLLTDAEESELNMNSSIHWDKMMSGNRQPSSSGVLPSFFIMLLFVLNEFNLDDNISYKQRRLKRCSLIFYDERCYDLALNLHFSICILFSHVIMDLSFGCWSQSSCSQLSLRNRTSKNEFIWVLWRDYVSVVSVNVPHTHRCFFSPAGFSRLRQVESEVVGGSLNSFQSFKSMI